MQTQVKRVYNVIRYEIRRKTILIAEDSNQGETGAGYEYNIVFNATTRSGRKVSYYYPCIRKFLSNPDYHYAHGGKMRGERLTNEPEESYSLTTIVTADVKLQEIQQMFPDCTVELQDADRVFTTEDFEELRIVAQQKQIRPWDADTPSSIN